MSVVPKPASRRLAVLAFHKIGEPSDGVWRTWNYVPTVRFVQYLEVLRTLGWRVIDAQTFVAGIRNPGLFGNNGNAWISDRTLCYLASGKPAVVEYTGNSAILPDQEGLLRFRTLAEAAELLEVADALITFDDGYRSILTEAAPHLRAFGFPAVVFVPTAYVGATNAFDRDVEPEEAICSWEELRRLESSGVAVHSHGVAHRSFSSLSETERAAELATPRDRIAAELGRSPDLLAFPYGGPRQRERGNVNSGRLCGRVWLRRRLNPASDRRSGSNTSACNRTGY